MGGGTGNFPHRRELVLTPDRITSDSGSSCGAASHESWDGVLRSARGLLQPWTKGRERPAGSLQGSSPPSPVPTTVVTRPRCGTSPPFDSRAPFISSGSGRCGSVGPGWSWIRCTDGGTSGGLPGGPTRAAANPTSRPLPRSVVTPPPVGARTMPMCGSRWSPGIEPDQEDSQGGTKGFLPQWADRKESTPLLRSELRHEDCDVFLG